MLLLNTSRTCCSLTCSVWKVPFLPVIPWQITFVFLSTNTAGCAACNQIGKLQNDRDVGLSSTRRGMARDASGNRKISDVLSRRFERQRA